MSANGHQPGGDHYVKQTIQTWDAIIAWGLNFLAGNVIKYVARYQHKGDRLGDLKKARHYLDKLIETEQEAAPAGDAAVEWVLAQAVNDLRVLALSLRERAKVSDTVPARDALTALADRVDDLRART